MICCKIKQFIASKILESLADKLREVREMNISVTDQRVRRVVMGLCEVEVLWLVMVGK